MRFVLALIEVGGPNMVLLRSSRRGGEFVWGSFLRWFGDGGPSLVFLCSMGSGIAGVVASIVGMLCGGVVSLRVCCF